MSHGPVEGRATGVIESPADVPLHRADKTPEQRLVRFCPMPMTADPLCGTPIEFNPALDT